jgi:hypothetical protein
LKREGKWKENVRINFLGLSYDPVNNKLYGNTRNGSKLLMSLERDIRVSPLLPHEEQEITRLILEFSKHETSDEGSQHFTKVKEGKFKLDHTNGLQ